MGASDRGWFGGDVPPEGDKQLTLDESAVLLHEVYAAYMRAGFSETQALTILLTVVQKYS